jgi:hypothetical protein
MSIRPFIFEMTTLYLQNWMDSCHEKLASADSLPQFTKL